jgi:hypothetical protein
VEERVPLFAVWEIVDCCCPELEKGRENEDQELEKRQGRNGEVSQKEERRKRRKQKWRR